LKSYKYLAPTVQRW